MRRVMLACLALAACRAFDASGGGEPGTEGDAPGTPDALPRAAETDDASTAPEPATVATGRRVFVTRARLESGNRLHKPATEACATEAAAAGLEGTFVPWLSDEVEDAIDLVTSEGPWLLPSGTPVFADRRALYSAALQAPIIEHADKATVVPGATVWTGTRGDGRASDGAPTCYGWTSNSAYSEGLVGDTSRIDKAWTESARVPCNAKRAVLCFQI